MSAVIMPVAPFQSGVGWLTTKCSFKFGFACCMASSSRLKGMSFGVRQPRKSVICEGRLLVSGVFADAHEWGYAYAACKQSDFGVFAFESEFAVGRVDSCPVADFGGFKSHRVLVVSKPLGEFDEACLGWAAAEAEMLVQFFAILF